MNDDGSAQTTNIWPLPKFHFRVSWDDVEMDFQEVAGLDSETQVLDYRSGDAKHVSPIKMPGMIKSSNVTMKKGVFTRDHAVWDWFNEVTMNVVTRREVKIALLDETGAATMAWKLTNAFPVKITSPDLNATGNEVAIESIELAHEGIEIETV
jgi:phage tail-like protein